MNGFANALMTTLLSWVQSIARSLWSLVSGENSGLLAWVADHWLALAIVLCVVCVALDLTVYFLRWRPHQVWASFFRRLRNRDQNRQVRQWVYADGSARTELVKHQEEMPQLMPGSPVPMPVDRQPYMPPQAMPYPPVEYAEVAQPEPAYIPEEETSAPETAMPAESQPVQEMPERSLYEGSVTSRSRRADRRRDSNNMTAGKRLTRLLAPTEYAEDQLPRYVAAKPAMDVNEAYHQPYIPPQWKRPGEGGSDLPG